MPTHATRVSYKWRPTKSDKPGFSILLPWLVINSTISNPPEEYKYSEHIISIPHHSEMRSVHILTCLLVLSTCPHATESFAQRQSFTRLSNHPSLSSGTGKSGSRHVLYAGKRLTPPSPSTPVVDRWTRWITGTSTPQRPAWARDWMPTWLVRLRPSLQILTILVCYIFHMTVLAQHSISFPFQLIPNNRGHFQDVGLDS